MLLENVNIFAIWTANGMFLGSQEDNMFWHHYKYVVYIHIHTRIHIPKRKLSQPTSTFLTPTHLSVNDEWVGLQLICCP